MFMALGFRDFREFWVWDFVDLGNSGFGILGFRNLVRILGFGFLMFREFRDCWCIGL